MTVTFEKCRIASFVIFVRCLFTDVIRFFFLPVSEAGIRELFTGKRFIFLGPHYRRYINKCKGNPVMS